MFLTDISLKRPVFATMVLVAFVTIGLLSYLGLNINDYPDVEFPYVAVTVTQQGASPEQIESNVAQKLEEAMGQINGVSHITSICNEGVATVFAEFTLETPADRAAQDVRDKMGTIRGSLPSDADDPVIARFDPTASPIISLVVYGDMSKREMTSIVDDTIKKKLETISGVGSIDISGETKREIHVNLNKSKLAAYGLTTSEVLSGFQVENMDAPGGKVSEFGRETTIRTSGNTKTFQDFADIPIARKDGVQLHVSDVATVEDTVKEADSLATYQGKPAIGIDIVKQSGTNTVVVANSVIKAIEEIKKSLPQGVNVEIVRDNSQHIRNSVKDVVITIIEGAILAVLTVFIFLRDWRGTMISALSIPASIITTFFAMKVLGFTLNNMSLMALSLSVGLLIDDAIVVIENITRHINMGKSPLQAAKEGTTEIGIAVTATTLTVISVFLPIGFLSGIVGQFFKQFGITVVCAVLVSLFVSFTLVPLLSSNNKHAQEHNLPGVLGKVLNGFNNRFDQVVEKYSRFLKVVLNNRIKTLLIVFLLFISSIYAATHLGSSFAPVEDTGELSVTAELDAGLNLDAASNITKKIENAIKQYPGVEKVYSTTKTSQINVYVKVTDKKIRKKTINQVAEDLREKLHVIPGARISVAQYAGMGGGGGAQFQLMGDNLDTMQIYSEQAMKVMRSIPGAIDVRSNYKTGSPEAKLEIKHDIASDLGISTSQITDVIRTMFGGVVVTQFKDGDDRFDVRVRLDETDRKNLGDLNNIYLASKYGDANGARPMIGIDQVTNLEYSTSPSEIRRYDRQKVIELNANLDGTSLGQFNTAFLEKMKEVKAPAGISIKTGDETERMNDTFTAMAIALITAVLFIFFILASLFESYIDPFSIMLSLPLAIIGAIYGLFIMHSDLSIMSMIGVIMLMGLVTKNAILLIDFTKQKRAEGVERNEALRNAALTRLRPIIMTSMAMILSMVPSALALGSGSESRAPMAHAIIGGLITSTLLTLVVVPVIYTLLDDFKNRFKRKKSIINVNV